jgi:chloramphenicol 3-O phosphotransferase
LVNEPGRVVILNGTSSSGKTTLIGEFVTRQEAAGACWLTTGIDDFIARLPASWHRTPGFDGPWADDGFRLEAAGEGRLEVRGGMRWQRLQRAYRRTVAAWAREGFDVAVDEVVLDEEAAADWREVLDGFAVLWVGVRCDPEIAVGREIARGDRVIGMAASQAEMVHNGVVYDIEVDTGHTESIDCARTIAAHVV